MASFNLVDNAWIPCLSEYGARREYGLGEALIRAPTIRAVSDPSPLVTAALYRLLLAVLHRVFGPENAAEWAALWRAGEWDQRRLAAYLDRWHERFELFAAHHPFYQVAGLDFKNEVSIANLAPELASTANKVTLFDHTRDAILLPSEAARYLVAFHCFAVGGLQSGDGDRSSDAAPLAKTAVIFARGENLFRTLMLNLHRYSPRNAEPFEIQEGDCPAWERDEETLPMDRVPLGYLDLLTWQSRRLRLHPEEGADGGVVVRRVVKMKGYQFPPSWRGYGHETMLAFKKDLRAKPGSDPWPPVSFREYRALWRDSQALFQSVPHRQARPKTLSWLGDLASQDVLEWSLTVPVEVMGMTTDRAKVLFWRHERLPLPLAYLGDRELFAKLGEALDLAEEVGKALESGVWALARLVLAPLADEQNARQPKNDQIRPLVASLAPGRSFWPRLETAFKKLLVDLPDDRVDDDGDRYYGQRKLPEWARTLRRAAVAAFAEAMDGLDTSPRTVRAVAKAEGAFRVAMARALKRYLDEDVTVGGGAE